MQHGPVLALAVFASSCGAPVRGEPPLARSVTPAATESSRADVAPSAASAHPVASSAGAAGSPPAASSSERSGARGGAGGAGSCVARIVHVKHAEVFRGVPSSPSRQAAMERLSPKDLARWHGADHGMRYLSCVYVAFLNDRAYEFNHTAAQGPGDDERLEPTRCDFPEEKRKAEAQMVQSSRQCTDPHGGAYWGFDLREIAEPAGSR